MKIKKILALLLLLSIALSIFNICSSSFSVLADDNDISVVSSPEIFNYNSYIKDYSDKEIIKDAVVGTPIGNITDYEGFKGLMMTESSVADFSVDIKKSGLYSLKLSYVACKGQNLDLEYAILINDKVAFDELSDLSLTKLFVDIGEPITDIAGNEIRPEQEELVKEQTVFVKDSVGYVSEPFTVYFEQGISKVSFNSLRGEALITGFSLEAYDSVLSEEEYLKSIDKVSSDINAIKIDAEKPSFKSSSMLYASCDKTSYFIDPYPNGKEKLNVLGGSNFSDVGQWVEYTVNIKKSGYYNIAIKYKQNVSIGTATYRDIYIDDSIICESFRDVDFPYTNKWSNRVITDKKGNAVPVFLDAGEHKIRICVTLGEYNDILSLIEQSVADFNAAYLESIMYLTSSPDAYRDYAVEKNLPNVLKVFKEQIKILENISEKIEKVGGGTNDSVAIIQRMCYQLEDILDDPETYPKRLDSVKSNITALASLVTTLSSQPLMMDYICLYNNESDLKKAEAGFFKNCYNEIINFRKLQ